MTFTKQFWKENREIMIKKISESHKGKHLSEEHKKKISVSSKGKKLSKETKKKISLAKKGKSAPSKLKGKTYEEIYGKDKAKIMKEKKREEFKGRIDLHNPYWLHTKDVRNKLSNTIKQKWKNDIQYRNKVVKSWCKSNLTGPNKLEKRLISIFKNNNFSFKYVGNGDVIIGGKCPDFCNRNNLLIELFGEYWHKNDNPQNRIDYFKQYGYHCLIIWEHELKNEDNVVFKIEKFINDNEIHNFNKNGGTT